MFLFSHKKLLGEGIKVCALSKYPWYINVEIENLWQQMVLVKTADREMIEQANVCGSPFKYFLRNNSIVQGPGSSSHQL